MPVQQAQGSSSTQEQKQAQEWDALGGREEASQGRGHYNEGSNWTQTEKEVDSLD